MLQISQPEVAFNDKRTYRFKSGVEKQRSSSLIDKIEVVVIYDSFTEQLPPSLRTTAEKIVQACKFQLNHTVFLNIRFEQIALGNLQNRYHPVLILVFGDILLSKNLLKMEKNRAYNIGDTTIIQTETLESLETQKGTKTLLWNTLQSAFRLK